MSYILAICLMSLIIFEKYLQKLNGYRYIKFHGFSNTLSRRSRYVIKNPMLSYMISTLSMTSLPIRLEKSIWDTSTQCVILETPMNGVLVTTQGNHPDEIEYIQQITQSSSTQSKSSKRHNTFLGGRQALRQAFAGLNHSLNTAVLKDEYGAPVVIPSSIKGSISHKDCFVVGLASLIDRGKIGVDLERCTNKAVEQLQRRLLTPEEIKSLGSLVSASVPIDQEVLLRFSVKESVHKALHPHILRPIGFQEVEVYPRPNGEANINFLLSSSEKPVPPITYEAHWERFMDNYWLTAVRISLAE